jgi:hypothetical protein
MKGRTRIRAALLVTAVAAVLVVSPGGKASAAPYEFEFTVDDYAKEAVFYGWVEFRALIENTGTEADTIDLVLTEHNPPNWYSDICIHGKCYSSGIAEIELAAGATDTVLVNVRAKAVAEMFSLTLTGTMRHDPGVVRQETFAAFAGLPSILLVDDDDGAGYETYMDAALDSAGYDVRTWDADSLGRPGAVQLASYWAVFWTTADGSASYITSSDEQDMITYLDGGGNLCLASMEFLSTRGGATTFTTDYLHILSWNNDTGSTVAGGFAGDPISSGMVLSLMAGPFVPNNSDNMLISTPADSIFKSGVGTNGLKIEENGHKAVFLSFPFEVVSTIAPYPNNQKTLMSRIMDWFDPPTSGIDDVARPGTSINLGQNSPNPFSGTTHIAFSVPRGAGNVELTVYNVNGQVVRRLVDGAAQATDGRVAWDGSDNAGRPVASGVYFYKLTVNGKSAFKKMVLSR